jgi:hypothetical protein
MRRSRHGGAAVLGYNRTLSVRTAGYTDTRLVVARFLRVHPYAACNVSGTFAAALR